MKGVLRVGTAKSHENINVSNRGKAQPTGIPQIEVDLIFKKLTKSTATTQAGRMDFDQFIKAMIVIAHKLYPESHDPKTAVELLC